MYSIIDLSTVLKMILAGILIYLYIIIITRIAGKRTFAKMTSVDFAITIAMGSILADAVNKPMSNFIPALVSLAILVVLQVLFSKMLSVSDNIEKITTNTPVLLMKDGIIIEKNLKKSLVSKADLMGKLREANVLRLSQVRAVIFETTGDISVLHTTDNTQIESVIMDGVAAQ